MQNAEKKDVLCTKSSNDFFQKDFFLFFYPSICNHTFLTGFYKVFFFSFPAKKITTKISVLKKINYKEKLLKLFNLEILH